MAAAPFPWQPVPFHFCAFQRAGMCRSNQSLQVETWDESFQMKHKSMNFNDINIKKLNHRKEVMKAGAHLGSDVKSDDIRCVQSTCPTWSNVHNFLHAEISKCRLENFKVTDPKLNSSFRTLSAAYASVHCPLYFHNPTVMDLGGLDGLDGFRTVIRLHPSSYFGHCSCASCA